MTMLQELKAKLNLAMKLSDAKAELLEMDYPESVVAAAMAARTKAQFIAELEAIEALPAVPDEVPQVILTRLEEIETSINGIIEQQATGYFELSNLLAEAKDEFDTTQEFLKWADERFSFKKAYVYRVLQVGRTFADPIWRTTAITNLFLLMSQGTEADIENAKLFIEKGGVLSKDNLSVLLDGQATNKPVKAPKPSAEETLSELETGSQELSAAIVDEAVRDVVLKAPEPKAPHAPHPEAPAAAVLAPSEQVTELLAQIAELTRQLAEAQKPKLRDVKAIPMLRQFQSSDHKVRLGLTFEESQSKEAILEAFRDFCRAGYGRGHEAFALLDEARHELIHSIVEAA